MKASITVLGGDGIGPEVAAEGVRCLTTVAQRFGHQFTLTPQPFGGAAIDLCGEPLPQATLDACKLRLRPIVMTSLAFIFGVVPLMISEGAGSEMRRALGTTQGIKQQKNNCELANYKRYLQCKGGLLNRGDGAEKKLRPSGIWAR